MVHSFIVASLDGTEQGEVVKTIGQSKQWAAPLASMGTAGFTVPLDHDLADFLLAGDALLKIYQEDSRIVSGRRLAIALRLNTAEEVVSQSKGSVSTTWADPFWVLLRRLIGKSATGYSNGTALAPVDPTVIASDIVAQANAESPSGVAIGSVSNSAPTYVSGWYYKPAGEALAELAAAAFGPTWRIRPQEPQAGVYGLLDFGQIGSVRADAAFEYGDGLLNVSGYRRAVSNEGAANRVFHLPPGFPDNQVQAPLSQSDNPSIAARGLLEAVVSQDLAVDDLRTKLLQYHLSVRKLAKTTISFDPIRDSSKTMPIFGVDYDLGDVVPFRAWKRLRGVNVKRLDALVRIYQAAFAVNDAGSATPTLTTTAT